MPKLRDEPCSECGWRYPGFHICVDLKNPQPIKPDPPKRSRKREYNTNRSSDTWRLSISSSMQKHASKLREKNKDRDERMIELYEEGLTMREIAAEMKLNHQTVGDALRFAQDQGKVVIRRPGERFKR